MSDDNHTFEVMHERGMTSFDGCIGFEINDHGYLHIVKAPGNVVACYAPGVWRSVMRMEEHKNG
jgi:hypothetical protein